MRFTSLIATALAVAPTVVYGYGVAHVKLNTHEDCHNGQPPHGKVLKEQTIVATKDTCGVAKVKHGIDVDAYSITLNTITKDTPKECRGLGIYTNEDCVGEPKHVLPIGPWDTHVQSLCFADTPFDKVVAIKLFCAHEEHEHHDDHDEHGAKQEAATHEPKEATHDGMKSAERKTPLSGLGL